MTILGFVLVVLAVVLVGWVIQHLKIQEPIRSILLAILALVLIFVLLAVLGGGDLLNTRIGG